MLTDRSFKILNLFLASNTAVSIGELANHFNLTERSIRYDIDRINDTLQSKDLPTIDKVGKGLFKIDQKTPIRQYIESLSIIHYSNESRRELIIHTIALECRVNISRMSRLFEVSRSTIKIDVESLKETLDHYGLTLSHNDRLGLTLLGKENQIRLLQYDILLQYFSNGSHNNLLISPVIEKYLSPINLKLVDNYLSLVEQQTHTDLSELSYRRFKIRIIIAIHRILGKHLLEAPSATSVKSHTPEYALIKNSLSLIEVAYNLSFTSSEVQDLTSWFISSSPYSFPTEPYMNWFEIETYITSIIYDFSQRYGYDFSDDRELKKDLIIIIKPIWQGSHQEEGVHVKITDMNKHQLDVHHMLDETLNAISMNTQLNLKPQTKVNLSLAFIASIERNQHKWNKVMNIIVVCGHGFGSSKLLALQLKQKFNVNVIKTLPRHQLKHMKRYEHIDKIITTTPIQNAFLQDKIVFVHPILNNEDIAHLKSNGLSEVNQSLLLSEVYGVLGSQVDQDTKLKLADLIKSRLGDIIIDDISPTKLSLVDLLPSSNILMDKSGRNWEDALRMAGELLVDNGSVTSNYVDALIDSFKVYGAYMIIKDKITIPHAKNEDNIIRTGMVLLILDHPIPTPFDKEIQVLLVFSSYDETEHLDPLYEFSHLISKPGFMASLSSASSSEEVHRLIRDGLSQE